MGSIMIGLLLGSLLGVIVLGCIGLSSINMSRRGEEIAITIGVILMIVITIIGAGIGYSVDVHSNNSFIAQYEVAKDTIENSVGNKWISGFERVQLVSEATELNKELVKKQYNSQQWYGFTIPDEILELEPIQFGAEQ